MLLKSLKIVPLLLMLAAACNGDKGDDEDADAGPEAVPEEIDGDFQHDPEPDEVTPDPQVEDAAEEDLMEEDLTGDADGGGETPGNLYVIYDLKPLIHDRLHHHNPEEQWAIWNDSQNEIQEWINEVKDHPALFAYYTLDEPNLSGRGIPHDLQQDIYNFVKSVDPDHKIAIAIAGGPGDLGYDSVNFNALDILIPDTYCYGGSGLPDLIWAASHLREYLDDHGIDVPVVFTVQGCSEPGGDWQGHVRDQINIVLEYGLATGGIGIWAWEDGVDGAGDSDRTLNEVRDAWGTSSWDPSVSLPVSQESPTAADISGIHLMFCVSPEADLERARSAEVNLIHNYGYMGRSYLDRVMAAWD